MAAAEQPPVCFPQEVHRPAGPANVLLIHALFADGPTFCNGGVLLHPARKQRFTERAAGLAVVQITVKVSTYDYGIRPGVAAAPKIFGDLNIEQALRWLSRQLKAKVNRSQPAMYNDGGLIICHHGRRLMISRGSATAVRLGSQTATGPVPADMSGRTRIRYQFRRTVHCGYVHIDRETLCTFL